MTYTDISCQVFSKKRERAFHRIVPGLQIARNNGEPIRWMTLTSSPSSSRPIKKSFDILRKRIKRASFHYKKGKKKGEFKDGFDGFKFNKYYCLRTYEGLGVLHVLWWGGRYIPKHWLKDNWIDIHKAYEIDIAKPKERNGKINKLVNYLLTNYLMKNPIERMSYGWMWAWVGLARSQKKLKEVYGLLRRSRGEFGVKTRAFHDKYKSWYWTALERLLWDHPVGTRKKRNWNILTYLNLEF